MHQRFREFDRSRLEILPLDRRRHDLSQTAILQLQPTTTVAEVLRTVAARIRAAGNSSKVLMMGAHVIRAGVQRYLIDLMRRGFVDCVATNGAGVIHDFELALVGATTESVARYIRDGRFGMWRETGRINDIVKWGADDRMGLGEAVGRAILEQRLPHRDLSVLAAGYQLGIPVTVHVGIGHDIVHELPNCDGAAYGATSYRDFLRYAAVLENLEGGVVMNFGSAVMAPEVFLKALAMVRNAASQVGREVKRFTTLVCDLHELPRDFSAEPARGTPGYYFRPWKTMLVRTAADGGESLYFRGHHADTIPMLWTALGDETITKEEPP
jgi:hypothetical protein